MNYSYLVIWSQVSVQLQNPLMETLFKQKNKGEKIVGKEDTSFCKRGKTKC